jgi:hypothetical protein
MIPINFYQLHAPNQGAIPALDLVQIFNYSTSPNGYSVFHPNANRPFQVVIDLMVSHFVETLIHAPVNGAPIIEVHTSPNNIDYELIGTLNTTFTREERQFAINRTCRYIRLTCISQTIRFPFIKFIGSPTGNAFRQPNLKVVRKRVCDYIGFNMWPSSEVRFYKDLNFSHHRYFMFFRFHRNRPEKHKSYAFKPMYSGVAVREGFRDLEDTIKAYPNRIHILSYSNNTPFIGPENGAPTDLNQLAHYAYALSVRYGNKEMPEANIIDTDFPRWRPQENITGLNLPVVFNINEYEGHWKADRITPKVAAEAYIRSESNNPGNIIITPNATAGYSFNFWIEFAQYLTPTQRRKVKAIEFHKYLYGNGNQHEGNIKSAVAPESISFIDDLRKFRLMCAVYFPNAQVWLTEIGYETSGLTRASVPDIPNQTYAETQGLWLVRVMLQTMAAGIDFTTIYAISDINDLESGLYNRCGLWTRANTEPDGISKPKASYFIVKRFLDTLGNYTFRQMQNRNDGVFEYRFLLNNRQAFVFNTLENNVKQITLNIPSGNYTLLNLLTGETHSVKRNDRINVNHVPVIVY